jgi:hypothetical protein
MIDAFNSIPDAVAYLVISEDASGKLRGIQFSSLLEEDDAAAEATKTMAIDHIRRALPSYGSLPILGKGKRTDLTSLSITLRKDGSLALGSANGVPSEFGEVLPLFLKRVVTYLQDAV